MLVPCSAAVLRGTTSFPLALDDEPLRRTGKPCKVWPAGSRTSRRALTICAAAAAARRRPAARSTEVSAGAYPKAGNSGQTPQTCCLTIGGRRSSAVIDAQLANTGCLGSRGSRPAFVLARAFAAHGVPVTADVRYRSSSDRQLGALGMAPSVAKRVLDGIAGDLSSPGGGLRPVMWHRRIECPAPSVSASRSAPCTAAALSLVTGLAKLRRQLACAGMLDQASGEPVFVGERGQLAGRLPHLSRRPTLRARAPRGPPSRYVRCSSASSMSTHSSPNTPALDRLS